MSKPIPQPQEIFLIGNLKEIDSDHFLASLCKDYRNFMVISFDWTIFRNSLIVVSSQELVDFVCDESKFDKKSQCSLGGTESYGWRWIVYCAYCRNRTGNLLTRILMPAFGPKAIRDMFPAIIRWSPF